jgi:branched-chain amino acid transport system substrate-binding protein
MVIDPDRKCGPNRNSSQKRAFFHLQFLLFHPAWLAAKILPLALIIAIFIAICPGCTRNDRPIKIGLSMNFSGMAGMPSDDIRDGALLAVRHINKAGGINGRPLQLIVKDDCNTPEGILKADRELIDEGCPVILGHSYSQNTLLAYPLVMDAKRILFTSYTATNKLTGKDDYFFRTSVDVATYGQAFGRLLSKHGIKRLAMLLDMANPSFTEEMLQEVRKNFKGQVHAVRYNFKKRVPWNELVLKLLEGDPEGIILVNEVKSTGIAAQKLRLSGFNGRLYATIWAQGPNLFIFGADSVEGMSLVSFIKPGYDNPGYKRFERSLKEEFNRDATSKSARAYEAMHILAKAMGACEDPENPDCLKRQLLDRKFTSIMGSLKFDRFGDVVRPVYEIKVGNSHFKLGEQLL